MKKNLFVLFVFSLIHISIAPLVKSQKAKFGHLSVDHGLSQNNVGSIVQDQYGFIWFGTGDGLNRFDGYTFRIFKNDPRDSNSISSNYLYCLYLDNDSMLWIGFDNGIIDRLNLKTNRFTHFHLPTIKGISKNRSAISCITKNKSNQLFVATENDGIFVLDKKTGKWQNLRNDPHNSNSLSSNNITQLAFDKHGVLWCSTGGAGVVSWNPSTLKFVRYTKLNSLNTSAIYPDRFGKIWVSAWAAGINCIDPKSGKIESNNDTASYLAKALPFGLVTNFMEDQNGLLWISTAEKGVITFNQKTGNTIIYNKDPDDQNSISDNLVLSLFEDRSGLIWCGTWQGGVNIFDPQKQLMEHYYFNSKDKESLINNVVWCISKGENDKPWIATSEGICSFDPLTHKFTKLEYNNSDLDAPEKQTIIHSVLQDDGQIWMGTNGAGLFRYNPLTKKYKRYRYKDEPGFTTTDFSGLAGHTVKILMLDKKNNLWIGSGGLNLYQRDQDKFIYYLNNANDIESVSSNNISSLEESKDGKIWVATFDAGLNLLDPITGKAKRFKHDPENPNSLSDNKLTSLHIDKNDILWIGTKSGLCCYIEDKETFVLFTENDGLPNNHISGIESDDYGNLWISTNKGICLFNPAKRKVKSYDVNDGVQSNEFKANSSFKAKDGYIYFGGVKGMNRFNPRKLSDNRNPPNLVLTGFSILNKPHPLKENILITKEITLSYKDYFFSFDFAGLEYTNPAKNKYKYILEGFNEEWINIGTTRSLTFTNLDPGEYTLHIQACNNDGVWSDNTDGIRITITPPFWKTKWFYTSCILVIIFSVYSYIKFREKKLTKEKVVLENKVEIRTKELKQEKIKVEEAHKEITDSIHYAKRIQRALLASDILLKKNLPEYFVLYKPKDIVSGDFYWAYKVDANYGSKDRKQVSITADKFLLAAGDCTGHGVPGAFMSLLNISKLSETVNEKKITSPEVILDHVRGEIIKALNPEGAEVESKDGMDCVLCAFDFNKRELQFAAANNPLWLLRNKELIEYKPDKIPVGIYHGELKPFSLQTINLLKNDIVYIFTDGYADQFGGEKGKKFKYQQLKELLLTNAHLSMQEQKMFLNSAIEKWKGNLEQVDDILIIGIKI